MSTFLLLLLVIVQAIILVVLFVMGWFALGAIVGVPWVRTPAKLAEAMFELAELKPGERVVDLGSGDGALIIEAAKHGATGVGVESHRLLVPWANYKATLAGVADRASFMRDSFYTCELPKGDVLALYLFDSANAKLEPRLIEAYPSGTRIVSRTFVFPTLPLMKQTVAHGEHLYLYRIP